MSEPAKLRIELARALQQMRRQSARTDRLMRTAWKLHYETRLLRQALGKALREVK